MPSTIALIGRPNVGKSTLFNRFIRANRAITHDRPGVTRDRMHGVVRRKGLPEFHVVDTGGITLDDSGEAVEGPEGLRGFEAEVMAQAAAAVTEAQVLVLVVDGREGLLPLDERLARYLRQSGKPVLLAVNKVDGEELDAPLTAEFHALGLDLVPVSGSHGYNMEGLLEAMAAMLPETPDDADLPESGLRLAMLGRPNAGKSSLINCLVGSERMIVSELAGTTRDSVDVTVEVSVRRTPRPAPPESLEEPAGECAEASPEECAEAGLAEPRAGGAQENPSPEPVEELRRYTFVDTAGVRRRTRITDSVERFSVQAALRSARKADVTVLVLDTSEGLTSQDKKLLAYLDKEKLPFLVVVNKIDLVADQPLRQFKRVVQDALRICPHVPVVYTSAVQGRGVRRILSVAEALWDECGLRVSTGVLNRAFRDALTRHQPPVVKGRRAKFYYITQSDARPPTFVFFVNDPERVKDSYARYLENQLRKRFGLRHAPMRLHFRASHAQK